MIWVDSQMYTVCRRSVLILSLIAAQAGLGAEDRRTPAALVASPASAKTPAAAAAGEQREIRAQLSPRRYTTLAAEIGAKIIRLPVPEGGVFHAGEILVQLD